MRKKAVGELALISKIRAQAVELKGSGVRVGIGDDCAVLRPAAGAEVVVTTDLCLEGRHFRREWHRPESVGHRCLARGLSDLAAMGAKPLAAFLSLVLPADLAGEAWWLDGFLRGFSSLARGFGMPLAGGDTAEAPGGEVLADIVCLGTVRRGKALLRSGARAGDGIYVTGALGGAAAELRELAVEPGRFARVRAGAGHPHLYPEPRVAVGRELARRGIASSCIDVSDGLSTDLRHLCEESGVRAEVMAADVPVHALCGDGRDALGDALHGGEDYELLFTAAAGKRVPGSIAGVKVTRIGTMLRARKGAAMVTLVESGGRRSELRARGFEHFRRREVRA